jgi:hypothetical protein
MKIIIYLILLNSLTTLNADPWGTSHPYGTANRMFFGPEKRSDSSPQDKRRIEERRDVEERQRQEECIGKSREDCISNSEGASVILSLFIVALMILKIFFTCKKSKDS